MFSHIANKKALLPSLKVWTLFQFHCDRHFITIDYRYSCGGHYPSRHNLNKAALKKDLPFLYIAD